MNEAEKRIHLRSMTETELEDDVLDFYLGTAADAILSRAYPFLVEDAAAELPTRYDGLQCEIAAYLINKRGAEGQIAHSENGVVRTYGDAGIPTSYFRGIVPSCGVPS
ncbi:MAG: phage head-tail connector protein [Clostridia bacterium]|nr:phage head-tail connector protein [Clostridia bacterium]